MAKVSGHRASAVSLMKGARTLKKTCNETWRLAPKAPMFTRKSKNEKGKKKVVRTKRLIAGHAYKIVASGAAAYAAAVMQHEAKIFRKTIDTESKRAPWLPSLSPGAIALVEQFLCAYAQDATRHAVSIRQGLGSTDKDGHHKPLFVRLSGNLMKMGYEQADEQIFGSTRMAPRKVLICKPDPKKSKKGKPVEDADYKAPEQPDDDN